MLQLKHAFGSLLLVLAVTACQSTGTTSTATDRTGFINAEAGATPVSNAYTGERPPIQFAANAATRKVIIYSHGTTRPQVREDCSRSYNRVPSVLTDIDALATWDVFYLCSRATDSGNPGSYIYKRKAEILAVADQLAAAGVPRSNIFLAGHSAGAWSSLMAMDAMGTKFNGAVLFAPACCGPRSETTVYPIWRTQIRPRQVGEMTAFATMNALVFGFPNDAFNRPEELTFLTDAFPTTVTLNVPACARGHGSHLSECQGDAAVATAIRDYLAARTGAPVN